MCDNAVDNYAHALESVPDFYKTQKICNKAVSYSAKQFVLDQFKTQETLINLLIVVHLYLILFLIDTVCDKVVPEDPFIANTKKYQQSDWLRGAQYWPYLYSVFNIRTLLLNNYKKINIRFP